MQQRQLRWCTERRRIVVAFWLLLALALIVVGRLVRRAWTRYRGKAVPAAAHNAAWCRLGGAAMAQG
jgi:Na+-transporting methylmalonyl-CoA/oxaloacetate decarboxylase gamma subunit